MLFMWNKNKKYYAKNPSYNAVVHIIFGVGLGFLLTNPLAATHPVRWGVTLLAVSVMGMLMAGKW